MNKIKLNCGFDHNLYDSTEDKPPRGEIMLALVEGEAIDPLPGFSGGLHMMVSATGGLGKTKWARDRVNSQLSIIHFMEPDAQHSSSEGSEQTANTVNELCVYIEEAWQKKRTPFVNSLSALQFASYTGFSLAEGGYSLGFTSMLTQLSYQLTKRNLPLLVALNARREGDSDPKFMRALYDLESSSSSIWWFKSTREVNMKTRLNKVTLNGESFEYNRKHWAPVKFREDSFMGELTSKIEFDDVPRSKTVLSIWEDR